MYTCMLSLFSVCFVDISFESLNKQFTEMGIAFERGKDRNGSTIS